MRLLPFKVSKEASLGVELEIQLIDPITYNLISKAKDLIRSVETSSFKDNIKPEVTQSMIEINSSIHHSAQEMLEEFEQIRTFLLERGKNLGFHFSGGGTHPFQKWASSKIFPTKRFKKKSKEFRYLSKRSTVFGQHIHIGCKSGEEAIYLTHAFARYVPQFLALSASSPFYEAEDTGFNCSRSNSFNSFPLSGVMPYLINWEEFSIYYYKMRRLGVIESMKDFYWDIRPKPEFGTVEIRVCDTPLTIRKAILIAAFAQALAQYLIAEKPDYCSHDLYYLYNYNRFQACRYGYQGEFIHPKTLQSTLIGDDIIETIKKIKKYAKKLDNWNLIAEIVTEVKRNQNDAMNLRKIYKKTKSFPKVVQEQCLLWEL